MRIRDVSWKLKAERQLDLRTRLFTKPGLDRREARRPLPLTGYFPLCFSSFLCFRTSAFRTSAGDMAIDPWVFMSRNSSEKLILSQLSYQILVEKPCLVQFWSGADTGPISRREGDQGYFVGTWLFQFEIWTWKVKTRELPQCWDRQSLSDTLCWYSIVHQTSSLCVDRYTQVGTELRVRVPVLPHSTPQKHTAPRSCWAKIHLLCS